MLGTIVAALLPAKREQFQDTPPPGSGDHDIGSSSSRHNGRESSRSSRDDGRGDWGDRGGRGGGRGGRGGDRDDAGDDDTGKKIGTALTVFSIVLLVIDVLFGALAAYLSWTSNSLIEWNVPAKLLFAIFAFFSNFFYITAHVFHKLDMMFYIRRHAGAAAPPQVQVQAQAPTLPAPAPPQTQTQTQMQMQMQPALGGASSYHRASRFS
jgi:hypothetical protein